MTLLACPYAEQTQRLVQPLDKLAAETVAAEQRSLSEILDGSRTALMAGVGGCAVNGAAADTICRESEVWSQVELTSDGIQVVRRKNIWKPRSDPGAWHGMETTEPEAAYMLVRRQAADHADVAMEWAREEQADRYAGLTTFAWFGARTANKDVKTAIAVKYPHIPIGVKNPLSGEIDNTLDEIAELQEARGKGGAPIALLYRGGENAGTPKTWGEQYKRALRLTQGRVIVDTAHGGEMAHSLNGDYTKSVVGQIVCMEHVIALMETGYMPRGVLIETSDAPKLVDPHMPLERAVDGVRRMARFFAPAVAASKV